MKYFSFKDICVSISLCLIASVSWGQYASGKMNPDTSQAVITDASIPQISYAATITASDMRAHLSILASDAYEGRETGTDGNVKAAAYIRKQLEDRSIQGKGTKDGYYQPVAFTFTKWDELSLQVGDTTYRHLWDYLAFPDKNTSSSSRADEVLFMGYGIHDGRYSDYGKKKVNGKTIIIYDGEPMDEDGNFLISGSQETSLWSDTQNKLVVAKRMGADMVYIIEDNIQKLLSENRRRVLGETVSLGDIINEELPVPNHVYISTDIAKKMMGNQVEKIIDARKKISAGKSSKPIKLKTQIALKLMPTHRVLAGDNVLGFIPGKSKAEEIIVVSAHYDHVGKKGDVVFNGADDNGSGTTTVLEIAEAYKAAHQGGHGPERSILFLWVTGEEKGLLGSEYYASQPIFPLENTVANVNIDMVGRIDNIYKDDPNYIYVIGSDRLSTDLHKINEDMNQKYAQVTLDYTYNSETDPNRYYYRSDHYNFARNGIPAIFFFNGVHDDYHQPSDTIDKIDFNKMEKIGRLIFHTVWELANRPDRIVVDGEVR